MPAGGLIKQLEIDNSVNILSTADQNLAVSWWHHMGLWCPQLSNLFFNTRSFLKEGSTPEWLEMNDEFTSILTVFQTCLGAYFHSRHVSHRDIIMLENCWDTLKLSSEGKWWIWI
jgi:hypothetical protein